MGTGKRCHGSDKAKWKKEKCKCWCQCVTKCLCGYVFDAFDKYSNIVVERKPKSSFTDKFLIIVSALDIIHGIKCLVLVPSPWPRYLKPR